MLKLKVKTDENVSDIYRLIKSTSAERKTRDLIFYHYREAEFSFKNLLQAHLTDNANASNIDQAVGSLREYSEPFLKI